MNLNAQEVFLFDLNHNPSDDNISVGNWNNPLGSGVDSDNDINGFINDQGVASTYSFSVTDAFVAANDAGATSTNSDFPDTALRDSYYVQDGTNATGAVTFSDLSTSNFYQFEIIASRDGVGDNRDSEYTATGLNSGTASLDAANNTSNTVTITDIQADASGNIVLSLQKGAGNTNGSGFAYLGAIKLTETSSPLSLNNFDFNNTLSVSPNPVKDNTNIRFELQKNTFLNVGVYDVNGRLVSTLLNEDKAAGQVELSWDRSAANISAGFYILKIKAGNQVSTSKLIVR